MIINSYWHAAEIVQYWMHWWCLTSSSGSSLSRVRELESSPTMKGVGVQTMSIMDGGRTGMYVCCQVKGYSRATTAWQHLERVLKRKRHINMTVLTHLHQQMAAKKNQSVLFAKDTIAHSLNTFKCCRNYTIQEITQDILYKKLFCDYYDFCIVTFLCAYFLSKFSLPYCTKKLIF